MRTKPGEVNWVWFDECATIDENVWQAFMRDVVVYGQGWIYLEEKPVKQIDFSKPVVTHSGSVKVLQEGLTLVEVTGSYGADGVYAIDEYGKMHSWQSRSHKGFGTGVVFKNVPEEPRDHLVLWKMDNGEWRIDSNTVYTKSHAEEVCAIWKGREFNRPSVIVKVGA